MRISMRFPAITPTMRSLLASLALLLVAHSAPAQVFRNGNYPARLPATIELTIPADAQVWFNGQATRQTGMVRRYVTPPLSTASDYTYELKVRWNKEGQPVEEIRTISVMAGGLKQVKLLQSVPQTVKRLRIEPGLTTVVLHGLEPSAVEALVSRARTFEEKSALVGFYVDSGRSADSQPPILGNYGAKSGAVVFTPRFSFKPGLSYRVIFTAPAGEKPTVLKFTLPKPEAVATTIVEAVYPSRNRLPENQLKFYIHFSAPMSRGEAYRRIKLLDATSKAVDLPFLELDEELWDPAGKRFTLFFDPGRIKRGLKPREEVGPALEEGKSYTLVIDRKWSDAADNPLKEAFRKSFTVGPPDDEAVDPKKWKVTPPAAGKTGELVVRFPKSMDHALLQRMLWVNDSTGKTVAGAVTVGDQEMTWRFKPEQPWQAGAYHLVADTALEDLSGNSIGRPFEVDVFRPIGSDTRPKTVQIPFEIVP
jgi:uncharacterized protein (TIGR03000 family)